MGYTILPKWLGISDLLLSRFGASSVIPSLRLCKSQRPPERKFKKCVSRSIFLILFRRFMLVLHLRSSSLVPRPSSFVLRLLSFVPRSSFLLQTRPLRFFSANYVNCKFFFNFFLAFLLTIYIPWFMLILQSRFG